MEMVKKKKKFNHVDICFKEVYTQNILAREEQTLVMLQAKSTNL